MHYRIAQLFAPKDMGVAGTEIIDLNLVDPISRITVRFTAKNGANDMDDCAAANILKIELVDGSDVLYSLSGKEGQAINFYNRGKLPFTWIDAHSGNWNDALVGIDFGRFLYDPDLALIPGNFRNLQLKITYDEDVCEEDASENFLSVYAHLFDDKSVSPLGFLSCKELKDYNPSSGAYEYIDIPTDLILRGLFVNSRQHGYTPETNIGEVRLSEDSDKKIPIDLTSDVLYRLILEKYGTFEEFCYVDGLGSLDHLYGIGCAQQFGNLSSYGDDQDASIWSLDGGDWAYLVEGTNFSAKGVLNAAIPHGSMPVLFHNDQMIEDWYDVTRLGSLQLRVKAGSSMGSGATIQVIVQQLRKL